MQRFLWRFIVGHPFMPACFTAKGTEMRVVAFADHRDGVNTPALHGTAVHGKCDASAGEAATAINLPAALVKAGRRGFFINLDPQAGATRGLGFQDSQAVFSILQGGSALTDVVLPLVIPFRELANRAARVRGFIPSTVNGPLNLTRAMLAILPQMAPLFRNSVRLSKALGTGKPPSRHAPGHPACGDHPVLAADGEAPPGGAGSNAPPQICEPRPPAPRTVGRDA